MTQTRIIPTTTARTAHTRYPLWMSLTNLLREIPTGGLLSDQAMTFSFARYYSRRWTRTRSLWRTCFARYWSIPTPGVTPTYAPRAACSFSNLTREGESTRVVMMTNHFPRNSSSARASCCCTRRCRTCRGKDWERTESHSCALRFGASLKLRKKLLWGNLRAWRRRVLRKRTSSSGWMCTQRLSISSMTPPVVRSAR